LDGDNVVNRSERSPWFKGLTLMEMLENVEIAGDKNTDDFRFPVQYVNRPNLNFRGFCGTVASGVVHKGDAVLVLPSGKKSKVKDIVAYEGSLPSAFVGQAVTITLADEIDISRGDMLVKASDHVEVTNHLKAHLVWMDEKALKIDRQYLFKFSSKTTSGVIENIEYRIDVNTQEHSHTESMNLNDIAVVNVVLEQSVTVDKYSQNRATGAFIIIDRLSNLTVAAGMIKEKLNHSVHSVHSTQDTETLGVASNISAFELELNALIRKHFPHWDAKDLTKVLGDK
jgi:sulfate adenylyltransferase subunit 1